MGGDSRNLATGGQASCHFKWPDAKVLAVQAWVMFYALLSRKCSRCTTLECSAHSIDEETGHLQAHSIHPLSSAVSLAW